MRRLGSDRLRAGRRSLALAATLIVSFCASAAAQTPKLTTSTFDNWTLRCQGKDDAKVCEIAQGIALDGQTRPIAQLAIGRAGPGKPLKIVFQLPLQVWLPPGLKLLGPDGTTLVSTAYTHCIPVACFGEAEVDDALLGKLKNLTENGKLQFSDLQQQTVSFPVSFKGFGAALAAMPKS